MNDTTRNCLLESAEAKRLKEVIIQYQPPTIHDAISWRSAALGDLGQWLTVMVWAEHQFDLALEQAQPEQRAQFYKVINTQ